MSSGIPLDTAAIVSTSLEGILYGISQVLFVATMWALLRKRKRADFNWTMIIIAFFLLLFSTIHMIVDIVRIYEGFVLYRDTFPGGPPAFFADVAQTTFVFKNAVYSLHTLLGDGVVIYRSYVVWQSIWIIILPMVMWCGVAASAVGSVYSVSQATSDSSDIFFKQTGQWITAFYAATLSTNLLSTGLLAFRIWLIDRNVSGTRMNAKKGSMMPVLRIVLDAGVLYSVTLFTALICFVCSNNGQYVVLDMVTPIISIAFYMIILRVGIARKVILHTTTVGATSQTLQGRHEYALKPMQVSIAKYTENDKMTSTDTAYSSEHGLDLYGDASMKDEHEEHSV